MLWKFIVVVCVGFESKGVMVCCCVMWNGDVGIELNCDVLFLWIEIINFF